MGYVRVMCFLEAVMRRWLLTGFHSLFAAREIDVISCFTSLNFFVTRRKLGIFSQHCPFPCFLPVSQVLETFLEPKYEQVHCHCLFTVEIGNSLLGSLVPGFASHCQLLAYV